jgi:ABC-2 type transport system ATP-binding protein
MRKKNRNIQQLRVPHPWRSRIATRVGPANANDERATMLEVRNASKRYRTIPAVQNVSFTLSEGEILGYLGPNGSGKSTTVKMITGMIEPTDGAILFRGRNIHDDLSGFRAHLGYVPEEAQVYTHLSGLEYLQLVGRLRGMSEKLIDAKARSLLQLFSLESSQYSAISDYSKGMKQRVLLSAALMHDPELLIFDEPLSGLDAVTARLFKDLLVLLAREGKAILYISHVLEVVERVCDRVIILSKGKIVADAAPSKLTELTRLKDLESVFAQLIQQTDTAQLARDLVGVMKVQHA